MIRRRCKLKSEASILTSSQLPPCPALMPHHRSQSPSNGRQQDSTQLSSRGRRRPRSPSRDRRRRGSRSGSDTESDIEKPSKKKYVQSPTKWPGSSLPRKTEYTPVEEKIRTASRGFGIFHEMWRGYGVIIDRGLKSSAVAATTLQEVYVFIV